MENVNQKNQAYLLLTFADSKNSSLATHLSSQKLSILDSSYFQTAILLHLSNLPAVPHPHAPSLVQATLSWMLGLLPTSLPA